MRISALGVLVDVPSFTNFWKRFAELMVAHQVILRDWPATVPAPGTPEFQINKLESQFVADVYRGWRFGTNVNPLPHFTGWGLGKG